MNMADPTTNVVAFRPKRPGGPALITRELVAALRPAIASYVVRDTKLKGYMVRVQPSGLATYYVEIGRGKQLKLGRTTDLKAAEARDQADRMLSNVRFGRDPWDGIKEPPPVAVNAVPTLGAFIAGTDPEEADVLKWNGPYAKHKKANAGSHRAYVETLQSLRHVYGAWWSLPLTDITPRMLNELKIDRLAQVAGPTVKRNFNDLMGVFSFARANDYCDNPAFDKVEAPEDSDTGVVRYLSTEERKRLESALLLVETPDYLRIMVIVSLHTGLRQGELFKLDWSAIDFQQNVLTVYRRTSKTKKRSRQVSLTARARALLLQWKPRGASGLVFPNADGEEFDDVKKSFASLRKRAEITNFRWHDLRHDYASQLVMNGVDLYSVKQLLGHSRIETTERYAHLAPSHLSRAVLVLDKL